MSLVIDGYNLMYVAGILGRGTGPGSLQRSRLALLNFLAASLDPRELPHTTVVFDSHDAPWGLPRSLQHRGITVRFAAQYEEADDLIEELIGTDSAPRRLVVVSSDHRIQRAARRRRAKAADSDVWYAELVRSAARARASLGRCAGPAGGPALGRGRELLAAAIWRRVGLHRTDGERDRRLAAFLSEAAPARRPRR